MSTFNNPPLQVHTCTYACSRDGSGKISTDDFKNVFSANMGPNSIPFSFDSDWLKLYMGKKDGTHVLGCMLKSH
jgi:hypothetical protein